MSHIEKLITKEGAARILSVSVRTIDNWITNQTLPMPTSIGRKVYWHPDDFATWLDERFGRQPLRSTETTVPHRIGRPRAKLH